MRFMAIVVFSLLLLSSLVLLAYGSMKLVRLQQQEDQVVKTELGDIRPAGPVVNEETVRSILSYSGFGAIVGAGGLFIAVRRGGSRRR